MVSDESGHGYQQTFTTPRRAQDQRTAEAWARAMFEKAPAPLRYLLVVGWRVGLGLRLGPLSSTDHVLGWRITEREPRRVRLAVSSWALDAGLEMSIDETSAVLDSTVSPRGRAGRVLWAAALPLHRVIVPRVLRRASTR